MVKYVRNIPLWIITLVIISIQYSALANDKYVLTENPRIQYTINENWKFYPNGIAFGQRGEYRGFRDRIADLWESVSLPHTWNDADPFDDVASYRRGISWYRKDLALDERLKGKRLFLYFEGVNQKADVYVNGAFAGNHKGGYTGFAMDITEFVRFDGEDSKNLVAVQVDNSHDNMIPPLSVGYALYGGIYRDVWLIATDPLHVQVLDHGAPGVYVSTPRVSKDFAVVEIKGSVVNDSGEDRKARLLFTIVDASGITVLRKSISIDVPARGEKDFNISGLEVKLPHLWSPDDPYLYKVITEIRMDGRIIDRVSNPLGFRWFAFDANRGFMLNGEKLQIRGTNRHQDIKGLGHALPNSQHVTDLLWIKKMGANFVRLAHYPQDPVVLETADRLGLLVWQEIPLVNYITVSDEFLQNSQNMLREMIRQHYNHPCVIMWGSMNEIFLWDQHANRSKTIDDPEYISEVRQYVFCLDSLIRVEDPYRYTTMAMHGSKDYDKAGIPEIPRVLAHNVYFGWYSGKFEQLGAWLDKQHGQNPGKVLFISEYGAGGDTRLNGCHPERFDFTGNWQRLYHESYIRQINRRPYLGGTAIWNQFDFSQPFTGGSIQHLNQKGMQTWDRKPKDVYYLYKANWNPEPVIYIASHDWTRRFGFEDPDKEPGLQFVQSVDVYSNLETIELFCNGVSLGRKKPDEIKKASWRVPFAAGDNLIEARGDVNGKIYCDLLTIHMKTLPHDLKNTQAPVDEIAINVGYNAEFVDLSGFMWLPDQAYQPGSYGFIGGAPEMLNKDLIAVHSGDRTPLYNYYLNDLAGYRVDVPDGDYRVELFFLEPEELGAGERVFTVLINGQPVWRNLDLAETYGFVKAVSRCFSVSVTANKGLNIAFEKITGEPVLCGMRVIKR